MLHFVYEDAPKVFPEPIVGKPDFRLWVEGTHYPRYRKDELIDIWGEREKDYQIKPKFVPDWRGITSERKAMNFIAACRRALPSSFLSDCSEVEGFAKTETYQSYKHFRGINSRSDSFKCFSGPYFHAMEEVLFSRPEFIKRIPVVERGDYIRRRFAECDGMYTFESDFTSFEAHFKPKWMLLECLYYIHFLQYFPMVWMTMVAVLCSTNKCDFGGFTLSACARMSGEMNTSLGNSLSNRLACRYLVASKGGRCVDLFEGDDGLVASNVKLCSKDYSDIGLVVKLDKVENVKLAGFCGIYAGDDGHVVVDPRKVILNYGWSHSQSIAPSKRVVSGLRLAKALSLQAECPHCPMLWALVKSEKQKLLGIKPIFDNDYYSRVLNPMGRLLEPQVSLESRQIVENVFGISISDQILFERKILSGATLTESVGTLFDTPEFGDCVDYWQRYVAKFPGPIQDHKNWNWVCDAPRKLPPLVGVELNPGPDGNSQGTSDNCSITLCSWWTKTLSVLNKMPRDCTDPKRHRCTVPETTTGIQYFVVKILCKMQRKKQKQASKKKGAKPRTSLSQTVRQKVPSVLPVAINKPMRNTMGSSKPFRVSNTEFVVNVSPTSATFAAVGYSINPALVGVFPWLSSIAANFETYVFRKLCFHYRPVVGTGSNGSVYMAIDVNVQDRNPSTKSMMMSFSDAQSCACWSPLEMTYPVDRLKNMERKFTRSGVVAGADMKTYDVCKLYVATEGTAAATQGEIYVSYIIDLYVPQMNLSLDQLSGEFTTSTPSVAQPLLNAVSSVLTTLTKIVIDNVTDPTKSRIYFPAPGVYNVLYNGAGTVFTDHPAFSYGADVGAASDMYEAIPAAQASDILSWIVTVTQAAMAAGTAWIALSMTGKAATLTAAKVCVTPLQML